MKVIYQGKEIELEEATDEEMSLDYSNPVEITPDESINLEDTIEVDSEEIMNRYNGDQNE